MKTFTFAIVIALFAALGFTKQAFASDPLVAFEVSNQMSDALGQVTVSTDSTSYSVNVDGNSTQYVKISGAAVSVTINNQVVLQGQQAVVTLADGTKAGVEWNSPDSITVIDPGEMQ